MVTNIGTLAATTYDIASLIWQIPLLGMLMVFAVLALLCGVLVVFKLIFVGRSPKAPKLAKQESKSAAKKQEIDNAELMAVLSAAVSAHQNNDEIIAVLTAAVSAYRAGNGEDSNVGSFRVVSFKRIGKRTWNSK